MKPTSTKLNVFGTQTVQNLVEGYLGEYLKSVTPLSDKVTNMCLPYTLLHLLIETGTCSRWLLLLAALLQPCNIVVNPLVCTCVESELVFFLNLFIGIKLWFKLMVA